jgi:nitrate/nitrite transport system permease protein
MTSRTSGRIYNRKSQTAFSKFWRNNSNKVIRPLIAIIIFLVIWQLLCPPGSKGLPGPIEVLNDTFDPYIINPFFDNGGTDKGLALQLIESLKRVAIGFSLSAIVGVFVGIVVGANKFLYEAVDPIFQVLRTIPPLAWLPIALVAINQNEPSAIFVIFITSIWPIIINTMVGVQQLPQDYRNVARVLQLSSPDYFINILFPATVPYIFTGLRIGIGLSWLAIVAAEMLVGGVGIGFFIWDAYNNSQISLLILALIYVGLVGLLLDRLVAYVGSIVVSAEQK